MNQLNHFDQSNLPQEPSVDIQPETSPQKMKWPVWVMALIAVLFVAVIGSGGYVAHRYFSSKSDICAMQYVPVCGVDGKTYSNACFAKIAKVGVDYKGECQPRACTADAKVCPDGSAVGRTLPDCEFASCLEVVDSTAEIQASCQNHPGPDFCPKGADDITADGVDKDGCVIWVCKSVTTCAEEGEKFSKVFTAEYLENCCSGLTEWESGMDTRKVENGECVVSLKVGGSPVGTCLNCGNGICENIENICNCSEDCD